jgi:hypothetical protein
MSIMAKVDRQAEAIGRYNRLGSYPNGHKTWAAFAASMQQATEVYFALSLMEQPSQQASRFFFPAKDSLVFGVLTQRDDGKIGRLCFPLLSIEGDEKMVLCEGFSRDDLQLEVGPTADISVLMREHSKTHRRVSGIYTGKREVEELLTTWLEMKIGGYTGAGDSGDRLPNDAEAKALLALRTIFEGYVPRASRIAGDLVEQLAILDLILQKHLGGLRKKLSDRRQGIKELEARVEEFRIK